MGTSGGNLVTSVILADAEVLSGLNNLHKGGLEETGESLMCSQIICRAIHIQNFTSIEMYILNVFSYLALV